MMLGGVFLINSQLFIPVSLHRGEQEGREGGMEGGREMQRGEGGREATAASMHRCSLLNVSISPSLLPPSPPSLPLSAFDLPLCAAAQTCRHQMASVLEETVETPHINTGTVT